MSAVGMDIYRAQRLAEEHGYDSCTMTLVSPKGLLTGKWLDAYFVAFQPEGVKGFLLTDQLAEAGYRCLALFDATGEQIHENES